MGEVFLILNMTTFISGNGPNYLGESFTSGTAILSRLLSFLNNEGWTTIQDAIGTNQYFIARGGTAPTNCWVKMKVSNNNLIVQGDRNGQNSTLSNEFRFGTFTIGQDNRLYAVAEPDFIAMTVYNTATDYMEGGFFGFPQVQLLPGYADGVWVGQTNVDSCLKAEVSRQFYSQEVWKSWEDQLTSNETSYDMNYTGAFPSQGTFDRYTTPSKPTGSSYPYSTASAPGGYSYNGALNGLDGYSILGESFFIEPRTWNDHNIDTYEGDNVQKPLCTTGFFTHLVVGMSRYNRRTVILGQNGLKYISTGNRGWMGIRIE